MTDSLAYCELYVSLGTLFRTFDNLVSNVLTEEDWAYNDYFSWYYPTVQSTKFCVTARDG